MPLQELTAGPVRPARRQGNRLSGMLVELLAVAEFLAQPRTDVQPVARVHGEVTVVEQRVHVRPEQQPVIQPVPPSVTGRIWAACRTGRIFEPVMAHLRS